MRAVSHTPSTAVSLSWQPIAETLSEFREECRGFEVEMSSLLDEVDRLHRELCRKAHDLEQQEARLADSTSELAAAKRELSQALQELSKAHSELADCRAELLVAREQSAAAMHNLDLDSVGNALRGVPDDSSEQFAEIERERAAIEAELELVRGRAAELYNVVAEQKREMAKERAEMSAELKELRRLVEKQSELLVSRTLSASEYKPSEPKAGIKEPAAAGADPVVNSVMAQFAKLQQDVAHRRKNKK